jgi:hypothetical protein
MMALFISCNNNNTTVEKSAEPPAAKIEPSKLPPANEQKDSVIHFSFAPDSSTLTATGFIRSAKDHVIGYLPVDRKARLTAILVPETKSMNIRFTQLIMPDSTMDGPFGQQFNYDLKQKGVYKIIISPNNMADGKTKGDFLIRLSVKEK